jgi:hypothetical protein
LIAPLQIDPSSLIIFIPVLLCLVLSVLQRGGGRRPSGPLDIEVSFVKENIEETYQKIIGLTEEWKKEEPVKPTGVPIFGGTRRPTGFRIVEEVDPRLLKMESRVEGQVSFELTEVQGGGTSLKTMFSPQARSRVQMLKTQLPLTVTGLKTCQSCSKMLLTEFSHCPYCGQKQEEAV